MRLRCTLHVEEGAASRRRTFSQYATPPPAPRGIDAATTLRHFALITYTADPDVLGAMLPPRLSPLTIELGGESRALVSVVSFVNTRFRAARMPWPSFTMAQINYRAYVIDNETDEHAIWFLHTVLDSWAYLVPRCLWQMPWSKGNIRLEYEPSAGDGTAASGFYRTYRVEVAAGGASAVVELARDERLGRLEPQLPGFPDAETGLVCLTHAFNGFFRRKDGRIAVNRVWHAPIPVRPARLVRAELPLLERLALLPQDAPSQPYSVLLAPAVDFMSRLPPTIVD